MMRADPLSDVLSAIEAKSILSTGLKASGDWSVRVDAQTGMKFNAVISGECELAVEDCEAVKLSHGDCFLLTQGVPFTVASDLKLQPMAAKEVFAAAKDGFAVLDRGKGHEFQSIGGRMDAAMEVDFLTASLPPLVLLRKEGSQADSVRWLLDRLIAELSQQLPGANAVAGQIMHMIFIEMIRASASLSALRTGWVAALLDPQIGRALRLIHSDPARTWRLDELAEAAILSRSQFSARFVAAVGMAPIDYHLHWKMTLASKALRTPSERISKISADLGYQSEAGFGAAFKRIHGVSPGKFRDLTTTSQITGP
jgi:AraC-like DNA-binding protein